MGYFSSIARQAGLRITGHPAANDLRLARPTPPEVEEFVTIDPLETGAPVQETRHRDPISSDALPPQRSAAAVTDRANHAPAQPIASEPPPSAPTSASPATTERLERQPDRVTPAAHITEIAAPPQALRIDEAQRPLADHDRPGADVTSAAAPALPQVVEPRRDESQTSSFFSRTAEMIDAPAANPIELQTVLLRELQEWVAAVPDAPAATPERANRIARVEIEVERPQVAVMQPVPRDRRLLPAPAVEPTAAIAVQEQNYELSIGAIHVVIEGDQPRHSPPPPPARPAARDSRSGDRRPVSPGRHYL